ncbi:MAG: MmgE/PrpD family protein [Bosea sp.]|uniref:MmgE/PrpD family protein n=1 Tax=Bosea sp. (in: a-proteobacteria) TaxID=1871050 RepID=UPI002384EFC1|nr:MmgE/PrpD family protein [Bosea sp. (in: a-proteobacteria)]MCP4733984.1 MmgE/PrpD family protein [Bosea sp. (in: a-proteobacteria)]
MNHQLAPGTEPIAFRLASFAADAVASPKAQETVRLLLLDVAGLCVAARHTDYVRAALASTASQGRATVIGHAGRLGPYDAALVNGTAAHGEDFDDTFEGGPVHAGAVIVPAVLAAAEHHDLSGEAVRRGIAVGTELMCRMSLVAPQAIHKACFHPTAVIGAPAAAAAVASAIGLTPKQIAHAIGIAGSLASGIIEYLADGSWTKRLHAGAAAQAGIRAAFLAEAGFLGPATMIEGHHGFYRAFAPSKAPDFAPLLDGLGENWVLETLAFKPYACGTMTQPFVDCAIALARQGIRAEDIVGLECEVGEGTVHRLWEPLALKQAPPNAYAAKFSTPYCVAVGFLDGGAGLGQFTEERVAEQSVRALAAKVSYLINPADEYPRNFSGHIKATLKDGSVREMRQPHMRGGVHAPLSAADLLQKFHDNTAFGGWVRARSEQVATALDALVAGGDVDLTAARG